MKAIIIILSLGLLSTISSCALNKMFLVPFTLHQSDTFSRYVEEYDDTLTVSFDDLKKPVIIDSKGKNVEFTYEWESDFFVSDDSDSIQYWLLRPGNYNGTTIFFLHGNAGNLIYQYGLFKPFADKGYQVLAIDYSGFGFSTGKATRKNVYTDGTSGLDYLLNRNDIIYDKLIIYGQSLGGHLATVIAAENQDKIDGLVIEGAFSSHSDIAAERVPLLGRIFTREMYSAEKMIQRFHKPVLVIHSTEDQTIPYDQGVRLYELGNEPKELYTIDKPHVRGPLFYLDSICSKMDLMLK